MNTKKNKINYKYMKDNKKMKNWVEDALGSIGSNVAKMRGYRGMTQEQLADKAGISVPTVANVEGGKGCNLTKLLKIGNALNCIIDVSFTPAEYDK